MRIELRQQLRLWPRYYTLQTLGFLKTTPILYYARWLFKAEAQWQMPMKLET